MERKWHRYQEVLRGEKKDLQSMVDERTLSMIANELVCKT